MAPEDDDEKAIFTRIMHLIDLGKGELSDLLKLADLSECDCCSRDGLKYLLTKRPLKQLVQRIVDELKKVTVLKFWTIIFWILFSMKNVTIVFCGKITFKKIIVQISSCTVL